MNREQRRAYDRRVKQISHASICPECNHKALFVTSARAENDTILRCERCGKIVREGEELTKLIPPGIYIPMPLETLDSLLLQEAANINNEKSKE